MIKREAQVRPFMEQADVEAGLELLGPFGPERVCAFDDARGEAAEARQRGVGPHALGVTTDHGGPRVNRRGEVWIGFLAGHAVRSAMLADDQYRPLDQRLLELHCLPGFGIHVPWVAL